MDTEPERGHWANGTPVGGHHQQGSNLEQAVVFSGDVEASFSFTITSSTTADIEAPAKTPRRGPSEKVIFVKMERL